MLPPLRELELLVEAGRVWVVEPLLLEELLEEEVLRVVVVVCEPLRLEAVVTFFCEVLLSCFVVVLCVEVCREAPVVLVARFWALIGTAAISVTAAREST